MLPRDSAARGQAPRSTTGRRRFWSTRSTSSSTSPRTRRRVTATLAFRRNPHAAAGDRDAPLVLDGEQQDDVRRRARRRAAAAGDGCALGDGTLAVARSAATPARSRVRSRIAPARNVALEGPVRLVGRVLHAMRARRVPPHHLFPGPSRRPRPLHGDAARRSRGVPGAAFERQPRRAGRAAGRAALRDVARPVSQAVVPVRARRRRPRGARGHVHDACRAARSRCASTRRAATSRAAVTRWRRSSARFAGTRSASAASTTSTRS